MFVVTDPANGVVVAVEVSRRRPVVVVASGGNSVVVVVACFDVSEYDVTVGLFADCV